MLVRWYVFPWDVWYETVSIVKKSAQDTRSKRKSIAKCQEKYTNCLLWFIFYTQSMIRRIVWLLIILGLAYGIYRWIDPMGAEALVTRIQSYFDKEKESEEVVKQEPEEAVVVQQEPIEEVTTAPVYTWKLNTGSLVELDYVLSGSTQTTWSTQTGSVTTWTTSSTPTTINTIPKTTTTSAPKPTPKKSLSNQDKADMKAFLNAIVE